jgi:hypothetical protein
MKKANVKATKTTTRSRKPLLVVTKSQMSAASDPSLNDLQAKAKAMGYDVLVLPYGASAYVAVSA